MRCFHFDNSVRTFAMRIFFALHFRAIVEVETFHLGQTIIFLSATPTFYVAEDVPEQFPPSTLVIKPTEISSQGSSIVSKEGIDNQIPAMF